MAEIFCNIDNSGVTNGTSFATGFTDIRDAWNGATYGDAIYINAGSTAYVLSGGNVVASNDALSIYATNPTVHTPTNFIGIKDGNTASVPMGDERPLITCKRTNGPSVEFPRGSNVENLRFDGDMLTSGNSNLVSGYFFTMRNVEIKATDRSDGAVLGNSVVCFGTSSSRLFGCSFISDISANSWGTRATGVSNVTNIYESYCENCVFENRGTAQIGAFTTARTSYGTAGEYRGCIFRGSGYEKLYEPIGACSTSAMSPFQVFNCIFYNCGTAIIPHVPTTASWTAESQFQNKLDAIRIDQCIFVNCNKGVETPSYTDPSGWLDGTFTMEHVVRLHRCAFYNNTVANTAGVLSNILPVQLSADPFVNGASGDFRLNDDPNGGAKLKQYDIQFGINDKVQGRNYGASSLFRGQYDFSSSTSNELDLGTGGIGDIVSVDGNSFQLTQINPRVWRNV
tara:strand:+ start:50 stop:1411 length:1362 start_codon:yes stop_codon:yes gene_type:complete